MKRNWLNVTCAKDRLGILLICLVLGALALRVEGVELRTVMGGITDKAGEFTVMLPWPGTTVSGRLLDPDNQPLAYHLFVISLLSKDAEITSPKDVIGFVISAHDYVKATITKFSISPTFELTNFLVGDVQLLPTRLQWSETRLLTWDDFRGDPFESKGYKRQQQ